MIEGSVIKKHLNIISKVDTQFGNRILVQKQQFGVLTDKRKMENVTDFLYKKYTYMLLNSDTKIELSQIRNQESLI